jgi:hypothetical protein
MSTLSSTLPERHCKPSLSIGGVGIRLGSLSIRLRPGASWARLGGPPLLKGHVGGRPSGYCRRENGRHDRVSPRGAMAHFRRSPRELGYGSTPGRQFDLGFRQVPLRDHCLRVLRRQFEHPSALRLGGLGEFSHLGVALLVARPIEGHPGHHLDQRSGQRTGDRRHRTTAGRRRTSGHRPGPFVEGMLRRRYRGVVGHWERWSVVPSH